MSAQADPGVHAHGLVRKREPIDRTTAWILAVIFAPYAVLYTVHALAPEMQPDAAGYHLGLVREYFRLGSFPDRIDFYGILPQGMASARPRC